MTVDDEFIDRILEGEAVGEEVAKFQEWLEVPANLEQFALRAELHSALRRSIRRRQIQKSALGSGVYVPVSEPVLSSEQHEFRVDRSKQNWFLFAAGLVAAASILVAFLWPQGDGGPESANRSLASIVGNVNGLLTKDGLLWSETRIPAGDYELKRGLLHLQYGDGVMAYVEAPARFEATTDKRVVLRSGRLSATVSPEGIGFTVETPEAEVVDFGTEFSVEVEGGASEVHVFDGLVRVQPGAANQRDASRSVNLQASQAVRIANGANETEDIAVATDKFIRNFDEPKLNYARVVKRLSPLAFYRMPIRDRGLISEPPEHSGNVLIGEGKRPPHARGVFVGGSLRVGADSVGRGGRVDYPPELNTGRFSLIAFVYRETLANGGMVSTNRNGERGNFGLCLNESGNLQATIRSGNGDINSIASDSALPLKTWRHVVMTADNEQLKLYENGKLVASAPCAAMAASDSDTVWFGTKSDATQVWNGRIDEVALFDRALTEEEIDSLYRTAQMEIAKTR